MTDKIQQARRAAFEAAYLKQFGRYTDNWCDVISKYLNAHAQGAWWAWQAALDSICIGLPHDVSHVTNKDFEEGRDAVIAAIEQTNLGIKIK